MSSQNFSTHFMSSLPVISDTAVMVLVQPKHIPLRTLSKVLITSCLYIEPMECQLFVQSVVSFPALIASVQSAAVLCHSTSITVQGWLQPHLMYKASCCGKAGVLLALGHGESSCLMLSCKI